VCNRAVNIPLGFVDDKYKPHVKFTNQLTEKPILIYLNFTIHTNPKKREACAREFKHKSWCLSETHISPEAFYAQLSKSKYVLSPEGTGIDCHRIYESIFFNSIPILKRTQLDAFYSKLPVIIVNEWSDVTESDLIQNYETRLDRIVQWKLNNPEWLSAKFWM